MAVSHSPNSYFKKPLIPTEVHRDENLMYGLSVLTMQGMNVETNESYVKDEI